MVQINQEETRQARRESKMDAMGTCTYVKGRLSEPVASKQLYEHNFGYYSSCRTLTV